MEDDAQMDVSADLSMKTASSGKATRETDLPPCDKGALNGTHDNDDQPHDLSLSAALKATADTSGHASEAVPPDQIPDASDDVDMMEEGQLQHKPDRSDTALPSDSINESVGASESTSVEPTTSATAVTTDHSDGLEQDDQPKVDDDQPEEVADEQDEEPKLDTDGAEPTDADVEVSAVATDTVQQSADEPHEDTKGDHVTAELSNDKIEKDHNDDQKDNVDNQKIGQPEPDKGQVCAPDEEKGAEQDECAELAVDPKADDVQDAAVQGADVEEDVVEAEKEPLDEEKLEAKQDETASDENLEGKQTEGTPPRSRGRGRPSSTPASAKVTPKRTPKRQEKAAKDEQSVPLAAELAEADGVQEESMVSDSADASVTEEISPADGEKVSKDTPSRTRGRGRPARTSNVTPKRTPRQQIKPAADELAEVETDDSETKPAAEPGSTLEELDATSKDTPSAAAVPAGRTPRRGGRTPAAAAATPKTPVTPRGRPPRRSKVDPAGDDSADEKQMGDESVEKAAEEASADDKTSRESTVDTPGRRRSARAAPPSPPKTTETPKQAVKETDGVQKPKAGKAPPKTEPPPKRARPPRGTSTPSAPTQVAQPQTEGRNLRKRKQSTDESGDGAAPQGIVKTPKRQPAKRPKRVDDDDEKEEQVDAVEEPSNDAVVSGDAAEPMESDDPVDVPDAAEEDHHVTPGKRTPRAPASTPVQAKNAQRMKAQSARVSQSHRAGRRPAPDVKVSSKTPQPSRKQQLQRTAADPYDLDSDSPEPMKHVNVSVTRTGGWQMSFSPMNKKPAAGSVPKSAPNSQPRMRLTDDANPKGHPGGRRGTKSMGAAGASGHHNKSVIFTEMADANDSDTGNSNRKRTPPAEEKPSKRQQRKSLKEQQVDDDDDDVERRDTSQSSELKTPTSSKKRRSQARESLLPVRSPAVVKIPKLNAEEQLLADNPTGSSSSLGAGARVYAAWGKELYAAKVSHRDGLGRYKVKFVMDGVVRNAPPGDVISLTALEPGKKIMEIVNAGTADEVLREVEIAKLPSPNNADDWLAHELSVKDVETGDRRAVVWSKLLIDADQRVEFVRKEDVLTQGDMSLANVTESKTREHRTPVQQVEYHPHVVEPASNEAAGTPSSARPASSTKRRHPKTPSSASGPSPKPRRAARPLPDDPGAAAAATTHAVADANAPSQPAQQQQTLPRSETRGEALSHPLRKQIFKGVCFVLTSATRPNQNADDDCLSEVAFNKREVRQMIRERGGTVFEDFSQWRHQGSSAKQRIFLIADTHYRTHKYLSALARGVRCLKHTWVHQCAKTEEYLDPDDADVMRDFCLPAGVSLETGSLTQWHDRCPTLLAGKKLVVYTANRSDEQESNVMDFVEIWAPLVKFMSGNVSTNMPPVEHSNDEGESQLDVLVTDNTCTPEVLQTAESHCAAAVSSEWLIQAIITGQLPDPKAHTKYRWNYVDGQTN